MVKKYCGKFFGKQYKGHDGKCGPSNGPQCYDCETQQAKDAKDLADTPAARVTESGLKSAAYAGGAVVGGTGATLAAVEMGLIGGGAAAAGAGGAGIAAAGVGAGAGAGAFIAGAAVAGPLAVGAAIIGAAAYNSYYYGGTYEEEEEKTDGK